MLLQACSQRPETAFQPHSAMAPQAICVAARYEQRMIHALPLTWHMVFASQFATLMASVAFTATAVHVSVHTCALLSHMHAASP